MNDILRFNGVPLDWAIDWALTDWNVRAGVFSRQGTWIEALTGVAQAAHGYLMPHPSEKVLHVRPRYPLGPWNWWDEVTPDVVLPADVVAVLADTGRQIEVGLRLPILPEIGLITPSTFVAYQEGSVARLGLVRSTRIEASLPEVWQTLGVETHA